MDNEKSIPEISDIPVPGVERIKPPSEKDISNIPVPAVNRTDPSIRLLRAILGYYPDCDRSQAEHHNLSCSPQDHDDYLGKQEMR